MGDHAPRCSIDNTGTIRTIRNANYLSSLNCDRWSTVVESVSRLAVQRYTGSTVCAFERAVRTSERESNNAIPHGVVCADGYDKIVIRRSQRETSGRKNKRPRCVRTRDLNALEQRRFWKRKRLRAPRKRPRGAERETDREILGESI